MSAIRDGDHAVPPRCFDGDHRMMHTDVLAGAEVTAAVSNALAGKPAAHAQIHNANPGCFAASVERVVR